MSLRNMQAAPEGSDIILGKRYKITVHPKLIPGHEGHGEDEPTLTLQYNFKPESFKASRYAELMLDIGSNTASVSVTTENEVKVLKGLVNPEIKESLLTFEDGKFILEPVTTSIHSFKQVRDEKYIGEEAKRVKISSFLSNLSKKRKRGAEPFPSGAKTTAKDEVQQNPIGTENI